MPQALRKLTLEVLVDKEVSKLRLFKVYYIPQLDSNLVFLGLLEFADRDTPSTRRLVLALRVT